MGSKAKRAILILSVIFASILADQATKVVAIEQLKGRLPQLFLGDLFRLEYAENPGAFLSLGAGLSRSAQFWILSVVVGLFLVGAIVYVFRNDKMGKMITITFALLVGGGLSNLMDRIFRTEGRVIDFMNMGIGSLRTGIFNVADIFIMYAVIVLIFQSRQQEKGTPADPRSPSREAP